MPLFSTFASTLPFIHSMYLGNSDIVVRVIWCVTLPFNPTSTQPTATTNKGTAAMAFLRGMEATLARELDSYCISYGYHRYIREVFSLHMAAV